MKKIKFIEQTERILVQSLVKRYLFFDQARVAKDQVKVKFKDMRDIHHSHQGTSIVTVFLIDCCHPNLPRDLLKLVDSMTTAAMMQFQQHQQHLLQPQVASLMAIYRQVSFPYGFIELLESFLSFKCPVVATIKCHRGHVGIPTHMSERTRPSRPIRCDVWIVERMRYPTNRPTNGHSQL